jgi:hypothetical protein
MCRCHPLHHHGKAKLFHSAASAAQSGAQQVEHLEAIEPIRAHYVRQVAAVGNNPLPAAADLSIPRRLGGRGCGRHHCLTPATSRTAAGARAPRGNEGDLPGGCGCIASRSYRDQSGCCPPAGVFSAGCRGQGRTGSRHRCCRERHGCQGRRMCHCS